MIPIVGKETTMGIIDSYGIELVHPMREGRSKKHLFKNEKS